MQVRLEPVRKKLPLANCVEPTNFNFCIYYGNPGTELGEVNRLKSS